MLDLTPLQVLVGDGADHEVDPHELVRLIEWVIARLPDDTAHPFGGSLVKSYDPVTLGVHPGALIYDAQETRLWRTFSDAKSHLPPFGAALQADYSDSLGAKWKGNRRVIWPGRLDRRLLSSAGL